MKKYNFYAGPAILPNESIDKVIQAINNFDNTGVSILEISHRSKSFVNVLEKAEALTRALLNINDDFGVIFLTGGASSQFFMAPMNLLNKNEKAGYVDSGIWASKAIKEAKEFGNIEVIASSAEVEYKYCPKNYNIPNDLKYLHLTSNNTIYGTQIKDFPETNVGLVCDMSSDIFSREIDITKFDLIYAGAQKNIGPAGTTLVIVKKAILDKVDRNIPSMLKYSTHIDKKSSYNTPPVFPIYVSLLTLEWINENGGIKAMQKRNEEKASLLYSEIDSNSLFYNNINKPDRSLMNVAFHLHNTELNNSFIEFSELHGCVGLKGHRSVGGMRASIYNAMDLDGVKHLVSVLKAFEQKYG
jgi:phosphoserine aminotransferase